MPTARTEASIRFLTRMTTLNGALVDDPKVDAVLRVMMDNSVAPEVGRTTATLAGSGTTTLDTVGGVTLIDGTASETIASIKAILIRITNPAAGQILKIGNAAANGLTTLIDAASANLVVGGGIQGGAGAFALLYNPAGWACVAASDIITFTNSGTVSLTFELVIVG